jgi:YD repeat-containing protein
VTQYTYYPGSGLLNTMTDPHLYTVYPADQCTYEYDTMGRKKRLTYPLDSTNVHRNEQWTYDTAGRLQTFINRNGKTQTFSYDALNRMTGFTWNDSNPHTPDVSFGYDAASRLIGITNANATISRGYFNDNLLRTETETATGGVARTLDYTYDADANRATLQIPGYSFSYDYTNRNQLLDIQQNGTTLATYTYDLRGNVTSRTLDNGTHTDYSYDTLDRVGSVVHYLNGTTRSCNYGYATDSNNRLWAKRLISPSSSENNKGEVFSYDLADQAIAVQLDVLNPNQVQQPLTQKINYDPNGNRTTFAPYGPTDTYATNNLNQYKSRNSNNASYELNGNLTGSPDPAADRSTYAYDAQNRLLSASKPGGTTMNFTYDGLNRQISRTPSDTNITTYNVWDGWDLVQEYHGSGTVDSSYAYGATGLVKNLTADRYYYQDGSGNTSHITDTSGNLLEWYRYDLQGTPFFYASNDT